MDWKVILRKCFTLNQMKHRFSTAYPPSALVHLMVTLLRLFRREIKAKRAIRNWGIPQHRVDLKYRRECWLRRRFSHNIFWENSITFHSWRIKLVFVMADNHSHLPFLLAHRYTISKIISWLKKGRKKPRKQKTTITPFGSKCAVDRTQETRTKHNQDDFCTSPFDKLGVKC